MILLPFLTFNYLLLSLEMRHDSSSCSNAVRGVHHTANGNTSRPGNTSSPKIDLKFIKPKCENGRVKVQPPEGVAAAGSGEWENALVGYFLGHKLPYPTVNTIAQHIWGKSGLEEVLSSENGFFLFKFQDLIPVSYYVVETPHNLQFYA